MFPSAAGALAGLPRAWLELPTELERFDKDLTTWITFTPGVLVGCWIFGLFPDDLALAGAGGGRALTLSPPTGPLCWTTVAALGAGGATGLACGLRELTDAEPCPEMGASGTGRGVLLSFSKTEDGTKLVVGFSAGEG